MSKATIQTATMIDTIRRRAKATTLQANRTTIRRVEIPNTMRITNRNLKIQKIQISKILSRMAPTARVIIRVAHQTLKRRWQNCP